MNGEIDYIHWQSFLLYTLNVYRIHAHFAALVQSSLCVYECLFECIVINELQITVAENQKKVSFAFLHLLSAVEFVRTIFCNRKRLLLHYIEYMHGVNVSYVFFAAAAAAK